MEDRSNASGANQLRRDSLGVAAVTFLVISAAAPLTVVAGVIPLAMLLGNGPGAAGAFLIATVVLLVFAVGYVAMARHVTNAGGFYAMIARGLGGKAGGAASIVAIFSYNCMQIGVQGLVGVFASGTFSTFGINWPWYVWSFISIAMVAVLGYRRVDLSARILMVLVALEYAVVLVVLAAILLAGGDSGLSLAPFSWSNIVSGAPALSLLFCFASFVGFESTVIYSEEAKNPQSTVPKATYLSVLLIGVFYVVTTWLMTVGEGTDKVMTTLGGLADPSQLIFLLSERYVGGAMASIMSILLVSSSFAAVVAFHNGVARYKFVAGREGILPESIGVTHSTYQSPHMGSLVQTVLAAVVVGLFAVLGRDPLLELFTWLSMLGTLGIIGLMAATSFAVVAFFVKDSHGENTLKTKIMPIAAGAVLAWLFVYIFINFSGLTGAVGSMGWILPGLIVAAAAAGYILAGNLKIRNASKFEMLGRNV